MGSKIYPLRRYLVIGMVAVVVFVLVGCSSARGPAVTVAPTASPITGEPVTVTKDGQTLIITNNSPDTIYHLAFPSEILPVIEWAPCLAPEVCPAEQRIDSGEEKQIELSTVISERTESVTVFWWRFLELEPGASVPEMEMDEVLVRLPNGWR